MTPEIFKQLLAKHHAGTLTPEEAAQLKTLLHSSGKQHALEQLFNEDFASADFTSAADPETLGLIYQHIQLATAAPTPKVRRIHWPRWAAAAAVLLLLGTGTYWYQSILRQQPSKIVQQETITLPHNKAVLTLADGSTITLDSTKSGLLAAQGNTQVQQNAGNQLAYNATGKNSTVTYNTLTVPRGAQPVEVILADGSHVWVNVASAVTFPTAFNGPVRKVEITGEAYFEIAGKAAMPFKVLLPGAGGQRTEVQVLGTRFNVNTYTDEGPQKVTLLQGAVKIQRGSESVKLAPGQQIAVTDQQLKLVANPDLSEVMAWKNGQFSFVGAHLSTIMREVARWYDLEVVFQDQITDPYTIRIARDIPAEKLFRFIEMSGGVKLELKGKKVIVKK